MKATDHVRGNRTIKPRLRKQKDGQSKDEEQGVFQADGEILTLDKLLSLPTSGNVIMENHTRPQRTNVFIGIDRRTQSQHNTQYNTQCTRKHNARENTMHAKTQGTRKHNARENTMHAKTQRTRKHNARNHDIRNIIATITAAQPSKQQRMELTTKNGATPKTIHTLRQPVIWALCNGFLHISCEVYTFNAYTNGKSGVGGVYTNT